MASLYIALATFGVTCLGCLQADVEGVRCLCNILHILTYADMSQQAWQDLTPTDCLHFIQLAQCALKYMLLQASTAHAAVVSLNIALWGALF